MKLSLLFLCICLCVENVVGQCSFSSIAVDGDSCNLGPVDLQHGERVDNCGLTCVCDRDHLHCCLEASCAIIDHTTTSVTITESGPVASQSKRKRRSLFFDWIVKRLQQLNIKAGNLFRRKRESQTTTPYTTPPYTTTTTLIACDWWVLGLTTPFTTTTPKPYTTTTPMATTETTTPSVAASTTPGSNRKK